MTSYKTILREIKEIPSSHLEEVYQFIHSVNTRSKLSEAFRKKILSYAGMLDDIPESDYAKFLNTLKKNRNIIFNRKIKI